MPKHLPKPHFWSSIPTTFFPYFLDNGSGEATSGQTCSLIDYKRTN